jgi:hypothetical protein
MPGYHRLVPSGLSDFTAKRLHRIAHGFSLGYVYGEIRAESGGRGVFGLSACCSTGAPNIGSHFSSFVPHSRTKTSVFVLDKLR